ncbi:acetylxylan esterase [Sutcliffiella rhizosphaerae]|uniref:Cephalosporin-C deacetylase n=1 Tax=Sutcliffiella rhizosphaerae TaxID=2880967 RepID=A0ABM8YMG4_9BACI|nr:alpha/beta fold hydrolase [Sutcliffiella rhizosphaerae]CAG9621153.1 Cephalosporin-C deacetylase [Sutcliffiella rhizosphaerae]
MLRHIEETRRQLESYSPSLTKQPDHDEFWEKTLKEVGGCALHEKVERISYPIKQINAYDVSYHGFDDTPIKAFYITPAKIEERVPCIIIFHGYAGHKNSVSHYMKWLIQGYAVLAVDCRGQGRTGDYSRYTSDEMGTWVTKGILDKEEYYYRKVFMDGVKAIDFVCNREEVDKERIALMGASMGGGIALAVAALDDRPKLAVADVPNLCDIPLAMKLKFEGSLTVVEQFLHRHPENIEKVYTTLTYFDNLNLCERIKCRVRMTVGLKDLICPPMSIFGVYNSIKAPKSIEVFPFSGHDMAIIEHLDKTLAYVNEHL